MSWAKIVAGLAVVLFVVGTVFAGYMYVRSITKDKDAEIAQLKKEKGVLRTERDRAQANLIVMTDAKKTQDVTIKQLNADLVAFQEQIRQQQKVIADYQDQVRDIESTVFDQNALDKLEAQRNSDGANLALGKINKQLHCVLSNWAKNGRCSNGIYMGAK